MYTNTPDENFILDFVPGYEKEVVVATGFSGHGFKFASVVGEIMADLAMKGSTRQPIGFLNAQRFS
jgi:sarcosine oxidase